MPILNSMWLGIGPKGADRQEIRHTPLKLCKQRDPNVTFCANCLFYYFVFIYANYIHKYDFLLIIKSIKRISICKKFLKNLMDTLTHANCSSQFKFLCISLFYEFLMHCIVIFVCILLFCDYFMTSDVWGYFLDQYTIHYFPIK